LEIDDASEVRIDKVFKIIGACKYGIHDISRTEATSASGLPRCNMPLELGMFQQRIGYDRVMSTVKLRREIKKAVDRLPPERLEPLAEYISFLNRRPLVRRLADAEKAIVAGKGVNWRKVRSDV